MEKILEASGLPGCLVSQKMGNSRAGNVLKLVEIVRGLEAEGTTSFAEAVEFIAEPGRLEAVEEMSLTPARRDAVRLMNLHKAKGLEAPVVLLANPAGMREREPDRHIIRPREGSAPAPGGGPLGYFVFKKRAKFKATIVSQPVGWDEAAADAAAYQEAEEHRLMYVAATRARDVLIISAYEDGLAGKKAWLILDERLAAVPTLPGPESPGPAAPHPARFRLAAGEPMAARAAIRERKAAAGRPSYRLETVTGMVRAGAMPEDWDGGGHGREWGTAVHAILSSVGRAWARTAPAPGGLPVTDEELRLLAANALASAGGARSDEGELAALVRSILVSEFWGRAAAAARRFFEVPFSLRLGPEDPDYQEIMGRSPLVVMAGPRPVAPLPGAPVLFTGAIDLAFLEVGGWVIADYKTDRIAGAASERGGDAAGKAFEALVEHYRPQVELYSRFWEKTTGETVKEAGLYFTSLGIWERIR
jgi:ATP-dependent helicase/nuclease subunit A